MTDIFKYLLPLLLLGLVACAKKTPEQSMCVMSVASPGEEYTLAVLYDVNNQVVDSVIPGDGSTIVRRDSTEMPYLGFLRFYNTSDPVDVIELPVAIEGGDVTIDVNKRLGATGTPLNEKLHEFLLERNRLNMLYDPLRNPDLTVDDLERAYSIFYVEQINKSDKIIGDFLEASYGVHILPADRNKLRP